LNQMGYINAKALKDGVEGWKAAGYALVPEG
jgi:rhodanese-related sulfurtransferase